MFSCFKGKHRLRGVSEDMLFIRAMATSKILKSAPTLCVALLFLLVSPLNFVSARFGQSCHGYLTAFSFPDFSSHVPTLTFSGDAKLVNTSLQMSGSAVSTASAFYPQPIRLASPFRMGMSKSFSSFFSFSMASSKGSSLAFVIAPSKVFTGKYWSSDHLAHTIALEFYGNLVGLTTGLRSTAVISGRFSMKDGEKLYAWIDYIAPRNVLEVRLSRSQMERPQSPSLHSYVGDLSNVWQDEMFVGFSSSTGDVPQRYVIYSWSFIIGEFSRFHPGFSGPHRMGGHGPRYWLHGHHDWHHGPRDFDHGPGDWHHGWHHEGFPKRPETNPAGNRGIRFDDSIDVLGVVISMLFGAACGTLAAVAILGVWFLIRKYLIGGAWCAKLDGGILFGYQKLTAPVSDEKVNANGYQKLSTSEPDGKPEPV